MARKPVVAYAIGGTAAAVAAIVITASTVGLGASSSEGARDDGRGAAVVMAGDTSMLTSYEDDGMAYEGEEEHDEHEYFRAADGRLVHGEREHDDDE